MMPDRNAPTGGAVGPNNGTVAAAAAAWQLFLFFFSFLSFFSQPDWEQPVIPKPPEAEWLWRLLTATRYLRFA